MSTQHVFVMGAKGLANYGGYETFIDKLTEQHEGNENIKYHVACKANGQGAMDETKLIGSSTIDSHHFVYHNADCFKITVPEQIGPAQAIYYDVVATRKAIKYCKKNHIEHPIFYILACRIGPWIHGFSKEIHKIGGALYVNPDGHEWMRAKWSKPVRFYWRTSEAQMVKYADLMVCDSVNIEKYIRQEYAKYKPETTFIAYGADLRPSLLKDDDSRFRGWMDKNGLKDKEYYLVVGRFVPENNFEIMIREFMKSKSTKDFVIITTKDEKFLSELDEKLHFNKDPRIKFVGTVYDQEMLKKIREKAYGYFHGHSVGGTNPSLLEALGSTKLNLLLNVGFNKEVAEDAAIYWDRAKGSLAALIEQADAIDADTYEDYGVKSKKRIRDYYSWEYIADKYFTLFTKED